MQRKKQTDNSLKTYGNCLYLSGSFKHAANVVILVSALDPVRAAFLPTTRNKIVWKL